MTLKNACFMGLILNADHLDRHKPYFLTTFLNSFNRTALPGDVSERRSLATTSLYPAPKSIGEFTLSYLILNA
jgi:hypothetical protein